MEFRKWNSIPRMSKERVTVTEKIDGSNSAIRIRSIKDMPIEQQQTAMMGLSDGSDTYGIWVQSRTRFLKPTKAEDNFGFAKWVYDNAENLMSILGVGDHYGEWWGSKIQRGYGLTEKRFSLFNAPRWSEVLHHTEPRTEIPNLFIVPLLFQGAFYDLNISELREDLYTKGSRAVPGFKAEGMIVYLRELDASYKVLLDGDTIHKWQMEK